MSTDYDILGFTSFRSIIESERVRYVGKPKYSSLKSRIQYFERHCKLLTGSPVSIQMPRTTRSRYVKAQAMVGILYRELPSDLFVLILCKVSQKTLCEFEEEWIGWFKTWWASKEKPESLSRFALYLCQRFKLTYRGQDGSISTPDIEGPEGPKDDLHMKEESAVRDQQITGDNDNMKLGSAIEHNLGLPLDQPIESTVSLERDEFLHIVDSCEMSSEISAQQVDCDIRALASLIRRAARPSDVRMTCPWYGDPSIEVTMEINVSLSFGEQLVRYRRLMHQLA